MKKKLFAFVLALTMLTGIAACSKTEEKDSKDADAAVEEVVSDYMKYATSGKYDKAAKLTQEKVYNISTMFDYLDENQTIVVERLLKSAEYEVSDIEVDDDKASCKVKLTVKDFEGLYDGYGSAWELDEFLEDLDDLTDTTTEKFEFDLVLDDENWMIKSDAEVMDFFTDWVENFEVPGAGMSEDGIDDYLESIFTSAEMSYDFVCASEDAYVLEAMFDDQEYGLQFMYNYINQIEYTWQIDSIDFENGTANVTISTYVPNTNEVMRPSFNNHYVIVYAMAAAFADDQYKDEINATVSDMLLNIYETSATDSYREWVETTVTVNFNEDGEYSVSNNIGDSFFTYFDVNSMPEISDEDFKNWTIEGLETAHDNDWISDSTYEELKEEYNPSHATEKTLYVLNDVFFIDSSILGMSYSEANEYFGGDFPEPEVWEWGTYDSFFDYEFNGTNYTFFLISGNIYAVRYEIIADSIPLNVLAAYEGMYGMPNNITYSDGTVIPLGETDSGYRFYTDYGFIDAFYNIYDDQVHVAYHYGLWW